MNFKHFASGIVACAGVFTAAAALPAVKELVVRQHWPFDGKVEIAFALGRGDRCDVEFAATWDGQATPRPLNFQALSGSGVGCAANAQYSYTWDPSKDGLGGRVLRNFRVTATPRAIADHMFLYVDAAHGTNAWYASAPADVVNDTYLRHGVLFRRVLAGPVGTYTNGSPYSARCACRVKDALSSNTTASYQNAGGYTPVAIGFTSDYFISCTWISRGQGVSLGFASDTSKLWYAKSATSFNLRGITNAVAYSEGDVRWPKTGFYVKPGSYIAQIRTKLANQLPSGWIVDLPTWAQQELAHRAGNWTTVWWNGGDEEHCSDAVISNFVSQSATWGRHNDSTHPEDYRLINGVRNHWILGQLTPNTWGIWDPCFGVGQVCFMGLDNAQSGMTKDIVDLDGGLDPVGSRTWLPQVRGQCVSADSSYWELQGTVPSRSYVVTHTSSVAFRLVINTSNWMANKTFD